MESVITDLKKPFKEVYELLDLNDTRNAMRSSMRREAKRLRAVAVSNLRSYGPQTVKGEGDLADNILIRVYPKKYGTGFMLTVKGRNGKDPKIMHQTRKGLKPILMWAEDGTKGRRVGRRTKSKAGKSSFGKRLRRYIRGGHSTGRMRRYAFLARTEAQEEGRIENNLFDAFQKNITRRAKRKKLI